MKRILLTSLLLCRLGWAQASPFELECSRLEPLLLQYDASCPARMTRLREKVEHMAPGADRAHYFWLAAVQADQVEDRKTRDRFRLLAVAEPGVPAARLADWLRLTVEDPDLKRGEQNRLLQQLSTLYERHPNDEVLWHLQMAQAWSATQTGQDSLANTLQLSSLRLAQRHGWRDRQLDYWLLGRSPVAPARWEEGLKVAAGQPRLLWRLLETCGSPEQWQRAVATFPSPPDQLRLERRFADIFARAGRLEVLKIAERCQKYAQLVHHTQAAARVEDEIGARYGYGGSLCKNGQIKLGLRQLEAALQLRQDHPSPDLDWAGNDRRLGLLAYMLAERANWYGQPQKSRAAAEQILEKGWKLRFKEEYLLYGLLFRLARDEGDVPSMQRYWKAQADRIPQWDDFMQGEALGALMNSVPPGIDRTAVVRQLRQWAEKNLSSADSPPGLRWSSVMHLAQALEAQGDEAGSERLWRSELERARERADQDMISFCTERLASKLQTSKRIPEMKSLVLSRLQDPGVGDQERRNLLSRAANALAKEHDPEALLLADQLVALSKKLPGPEPGYAYSTQSFVLSAFDRNQAALQALDKAGPGPGGLSIVRDREGHLVSSGGSEITRARLLWKLNRQQEALDLLESILKNQQAAELPILGGALRQLSEYRRQRGEDWQPAYARALEELLKRGDNARSLAGALEHDWLEALARLERWDEGRGVLQKYGWKLSAIDQLTKDLQAFPAWCDLLPGPAPTAQSPEPTGSLSQVVDELRLAHPELGQWLSLRSTNLKHLQARLGPKDTLVTYCALGDELYVLTLRAEGGFAVQSHAPQWRRRITEYLSALALEQRGAAEADLFSLLLQPILRDDPQQRLFVVPTGDLWQVPFGALRNAQGQSLASQAQVTMLSSGDLLRLADNSWQPYRLSQPLAIGAPPDADLPGAYQELEEVSQLLPGCQLKRGPQATSQILYDPNQQWGLVHFASHAHYRRDRPTESDIQLSDGPLRLKELNRMSLAEHSLVTLSCCQGGAAAGQGLEEPVTLATGFSAAGAETVVANLWKVDDEVARMFFGQFYGELARGSSPGDSFRSAQTQCRRRYPKTRDWGGFFLLGNPS